ncbi:MAG: hypothetical protein ACLUHJ_08600 [Ruminococcus sp.]
MSIDDVKQTLESISHVVFDYAGEHCALILWLLTDLLLGVVMRGRV